jgi:hypothetical protein
MSHFNRDSMLLSPANPGAESRFERENNARLEPWQRVGESRFEHENRRLTEVKRVGQSKIDQELTAAKFRIAEAMNTDSSMEAIMDIEMATKYLHAALILAREEMK